MTRSARLDPRPGAPAPARVADTVATSGARLDPAERRPAERRLGQPLDDVRIHTGPDAHRSAAELGATAYTVGRHVVLGRRAEQLTREPWRRLLTHELAHTVQQLRVPDAALADARLGSRHGPAETAADRAAGLTPDTTRGGDTSGGGHGGRHATPADGAGHQPATPSATVQRFDFVRDVVGLFAGDDYEDDTLQEYLRTVAEGGGPEDHSDSDNRARALVRRWAGGNSPFVLTPAIIGSLIHEMLAGATLDGDEQAILELLDRSDNGTLTQLFTSGGVTAEQLLDDFHGDEDTRLRSFLERRFTGGARALTAGNVEPRGEPVPLGITLETAAAAATGAGLHPGDHQPEATCVIDQPGNCAAYEAWIETFRALPLFDPQSGASIDPDTAATRMTVIGDKAAPDATATDPAAPSDQRRPPVLHGRTPYLPEDRFIDGPTDAWVRATLRPNLFAVAYQLPSDCADIAVILRHVWLASQGRTESYRGWVIGSQLGQPESRAVQNLIRNQIYSGNVSRLVRPYTGDGGNALVSWAELEDRIHVGDMLVWSHTSTGGGHTHTIMGIRRNAEGRVTQLDLLQGNQPIGRFEAERIARNRTDVTATSLRAAPGRRIERSRLSLDENGLRDMNGSWTWDDGTTVLVAAGPPVDAGQRQQRNGPTTTAGLGDWIAAVGSAPTIDELQSRVEAAVLDARARLESGGDAVVADAERFAAVVGSRLWALAKRATADRRRSVARPGERGSDLLAEDLAASSHFRPLRQMERLLATLAARSSDTEFRRMIERIAVGLDRAGRGGDDLTFDPDADARVLLTGFDPFDGAGAPPAGRFNPSGAAVLQLGGQPVSANGRTADVEGVILPVDFAAFRAGVVEGVVGPQVADLDAVITVSLDSSIAPGGPLELERYAVGVHQLHNRTMEPVPGIGPTTIGPAGPEPGPAILPARNADGIADRVAGSVGTGSASAGSPDLVEDRAIQFRFVERTEADRALVALGLAPQHTSMPTIDDAAAIATIASSAVRGVGDHGIRFDVSGQSFQTWIERGPGGSFLSNEVSYRVLRQLAASDPTQNITSFHVHTPGGTRQSQSDIPELDGTAETLDASRGALGTARHEVARIVGVLQQIVKRVLGRTP